MEIEVRILDIDVCEIRNKIIKNNGVLTKKENQINDIFDFKDRSLLNKKGYARIRIVDDLLNDRKIYYMTTKKKVSGDKDKYKIMDEQEVQISDSEIGENIFKALGLIKTNQIKKYRESYKIDDVLIEIDINDESLGINPYIEIEGETKEDIEKIVHILGYKMSDTTSKSIFELLKNGNKN